MTSLFSCLQAKGRVRPGKVGISSRRLAFRNSHSLDQFNIQFSFPNACFWWKELEYLERTQAGTGGGGDMQTPPSPLIPRSDARVCWMWISGKKNTPTRKQTCQDVSAQRGVLERLEMKSCLRTHASIPPLHRHQQLHLHLPSRGCRSEKLNFSDEEVVFSPLPPFPSSLPPFLSSHPFFNSFPYLRTINLCMWR